MNNNAQLADRKFIIGGFFVLIAIVYIIRLFYLQVIDKSYEASARNNALQTLTEYPPRGFIYDRNGKLLVINEASYDLMVTPKLVKGCDTMALCEILEITKQLQVMQVVKIFIWRNLIQVDYANGQNVLEEAMQTEGIRF